MTHFDNGATVEISAPYFPTWHGQRGVVTHTHTEGYDHHLIYFVALDDGAHFFLPYELKRVEPTIAVGSRVSWMPEGATDARPGVVEAVRLDWNGIVQYVVKFEFGATRWCWAWDLQLADEEVDKERE